MMERDTRMPAYGDYYRHYKGGLYRVIGIGFDTRDGNALVIYQGAGAGAAGLWARPLGEFLGFTEDHKPRFTQEARR